MALKKRGDRTRQRKEGDMLASWLMLTPMLVIFTLFFILPLLYTIFYSFTDWNNYSLGIKFTGLQNYKNILKDSTLLIGIKNSLIYAFVTVLLQNVISLPVAVVLSSKLPARNFFRTLFFTPSVLSILVIGYLFSYILSSDNFGLMNTLLNSIGMGPINFLGSSDTALASIIGTQVWQWFGWSMVIYIANLQNIPQDFYEAARLDGASAIQQFFHITLPNLAPSLKINLITGMISGLKVFDIVFSLTQGGPGNSTETILTLMFSKFSDGDYGYASAFGIAFLVITMLLTVVVLGIFNKWEKRLQ
ncbi:MAG: sugar ABC transporter permease [Sporolactobacillus sp.]|jgi:raffinose/stachyose/melibiose transport system permease protein|nr:sugar ABC transporter permease [Sporolactobacillus sp.]